MDSDLPAAGTGGIEIFLRIAFDLRRTASAPFKLISEPCQPIGQFRLIDSSGKLLRGKEASRLERPCRPVLQFRHIEDHSVSMQLRCGVAFDGPSRVVFERGDDELTSGLGRMVAADASLGITLELV